ncbi:hypothetical protein MTR67_013460 [Solanum verrucosum]|uniref:Uncharacterized protein n=1 Tax=Solanum verrucosum TaxID=315347 RepID=A0AAF0QD70_SOLVR|nr:hypothetical protein MTR67_013460 [Solanum verrucosum]
MYVDIIFLKLTIIEDLYLEKLLYENKGGVSKSEIQSYDVRNDVKREKFNEGIRHAEYFFPMDNRVNLFIVKLGGMVKVNCVWDPGISCKTMHQNGLMETTEAHLLLEFIDITSRLFNYFYDAHLKESTQSKERRKTTLRGLLVFPYVWLSLSQDNGWQVLLDIYTCVEAKDMPSDIMRCVLTLVYAALLEPKQERPVYIGQSHNNGQYMSIVCTTLMVPISVPKMTIVLVWGQEYILPPWLVHIHPNLRNMAFNMPMFSAKTSSQIHQKVSTDQCIVTFKWVKVVQSTQLLFSEAIGEEHAISIVILLNLEDKVLIDDGSIVMNQVQPNIDTNVIQVVIGLTRAIGPRTSNRARLIWDPG